MGRKREPSSGMKTGINLRTKVKFFHFILFYDYSSVREVCFLFEAGHILFIHQSILHAVHSFAIQCLPCCCLCFVPLLMGFTIKSIPEDVMSSTPVNNTSNVVS